MSDPYAATPAQYLSEPERLGDVFVAPTKTFADVRRVSRWWVPLLLGIVVSLCYSTVILKKVGIATLTESTIRSNPGLESRIANAAPEVAASIRHSVGVQVPYFMYLAPLFWFAIGLVVAAIFLATANFGFGGRAGYGQMLAVWFYGTLPLLGISLIAITLVFAGVGTENFNLRNAAGTNVGYYLQDGSSPRWLVTMLSSVDIFALWAALALTIGVSIVAGIKRGAAAVVVFGWWASYVLVLTAFSAVSG